MGEMEFAVSSDESGADMWIIVVWLYDRVLIWERAITVV